jgi:putative membrane protein
MKLEELSPWLSAADRERVAQHQNTPNALLLLIAEGFQAAAQAGRTSEYRWVELERRVAELTDIQGGCERILGTPIPHSYSILMHRIVALYVFALPFALVGTTHLFTPLVVLMVAYTFLGLDAVGSEIEDPFGKDLNDLPLSTLSRMIEVNLREMLGESEIPPLLQPVDGYFE